MQRWLKRLRGRFQTAWLADDAFIESAYMEILGRPADQDGLNFYRALLRDGMGRTAILLSLMRSDEFRKTLEPTAHATLPDLREERPDRYAIVKDLSNGRDIHAFHAAAPSDFDWLESKILGNGYYEKPGVWNLGIDTDKRVIAEIIAAFGPAAAIELGCAAGAVLECLLDHGVAAEGVEISSMAIERAAEAVRPRIHQGDLLGLALPARYDLVFGLDIFEHLNPNRIDAYVSRISDLLVPGGYAFCNIPAFGQDPQFGTVFPLYLEAWNDERAAGLFSTLHTDPQGYPLHGHLTWATADWWVARFAARGFAREAGIERALHRRYDDYMEKRSPARKAFFVFSKQGAAERSAAIVKTIMGR